MTKPGIFTKGARSVRQFGKAKAPGIRAATARAAANSNEQGRRPRAAAGGSGREPPSGPSSRRRNKAPYVFASLGKTVMVGHVAASGPFQNKRVAGGLSGIGSLTGKPALRFNSKAEVAKLRKASEKRLHDNDQPANDNLFAKQAEAKHIYIPTRLHNSVVLAPRQTTLRRSHATTFERSDYQTVRSVKMARVHRNFGGEGASQAKALGKFAATNPHASRDQLAVANKWSTMRFQARIDVPAGQEFHIGKTAPQPKSRNGKTYAGGEEQVVFTNGFSEKWIKSIHDRQTGVTYTREGFKAAFPEQYERMHE